MVLVVVLVGVGVGVSAAVLYSSNGKNPAKADPADNAWFWKNVI